jgi:hypothetical protein
MVIAAAVISLLAFLLLPILLIRFRTRWVAAFNIAVTNRITSRFAARLPGFGILTHVGRKSGNGAGVIVIQEVCDPCELNLYYEGPNGNIVSDFALPPWWVPGDPNQVDFLGAIPGPWQLASGGYISYQNVTLSGWQQVFEDKAQQDLEKAGEAIRERIASVGNPRMDVIRKLQAKGGRDPLVDSHGEVMRWVRQEPPLRA